MICSTSTAGCNAALADQVYDHVNRNDIPFTDDDLRIGRHNLNGMDPILHTQDANLRQSLNVTLDGHRFHPGDVTHKVHFEGGNLYYDVIGTGSGGSGRFNNWIGVQLFKPGVHSVVHNFGR